MYEPYKTGRRHPHRPQSQSKHRCITPITPSHDTPRFHAKPVPGARHQHQTPRWIPHLLGVRRNVSRRSKRTTQNPGYRTTQRQQCRQRHHPPIRRYFTKRILHTARLFRSQPRVLSVQHVRRENDAFSLDYGGVGNSYRNITGTIMAATGEKPRQPSPDGMAKPMKCSTRTRPNSAPPTPTPCTSGASAPPDNPNCTSPTSKNCQRPTARQVGGQRRALLLSRGRRQRIELQRDLQ